MWPFSRSSTTLPTDLADWQSFRSWSLRKGPLVCFFVFGYIHGYMVSWRGLSGSTWKCLIPLWAFHYWTHFSFSTQRAGTWFSLPCLNPAASSLCCHVLMGDKPHRLRLWMIAYRQTEFAIFNEVKQKKNTVLPFKLISFDLRSNTYQSAFLTKTTKSNVGLAERER